MSLKDPGLVAPADEPASLVNEDDVLAQDDELSGEFAQDDGSGDDTDLTDELSEDDLEDVAGGATIDSFGDSGGGLPGPPP
ncbi:MAG TPA: hypothetical protein VKY74_27345 [Chloroflexia bacterium]|nr:hypothetical protein [Chloroflexia bacterium]